MTTINTDGEFDEMMKDSSPMIIDFWASWCFPCKTLSPILERVSENNQNVKFVKINVEQIGPGTAHFEITSIPTLVFMKDGKEVHRSLGAITESKLQDLISKSFN